MPLLTFKLSLITFWGLWLCVVLLTNVCEELKLLRILPPYWRFASQNFQAIADATRRYQAPPWVPHILFVGVLVWQMGTVVIFGEAIVASWVTGTVAMGLVNTALASSLGLLAAFMIADEVFTQYDLERAHALFFICSIGDVARSAHLTGRVKKESCSLRIARRRDFVIDREKACSYHLFETA